jgi:Tol biopolymer transport system component
MEGRSLTGRARLLNCLRPRQTRLRKGGVWICCGLAAVMAASGASVASSIATGKAPLARIAYESSGRILSIAADGTDRRRLTNGVKPHRFGYGDHSPDYSPDGSRIAFWRAIKVNRFGVRTRIEVMNASGHDRQTLSLSGAHSYELDPQWAPDDRHLAFTRYAETKRAFTSSIVVMRDDGTHRRTIAGVRIGPHTQRLIFIGEPVWTPDGEHLVFTKTRLDRHYFYRPSLVSITKRGTGRHLVARDAGSASFSPDGSQITFASIRDQHGSECYEDECAYHGEIYVANADGSHPRRLTDTLANEAGPDWAADGQRIVFSRQRESHGRDRPEQLFSITPNGGCLTRLTEGIAGSLAPNWQPNPSLSSDPAGCL